jgi:hypothetical protein
MTTIDVDLQAIARQIEGKNNGEIRGLRDRILGEIEEIRQEVAARAGGRLAQSSGTSGPVPTHQLEQRASLKQRMAHYLDNRLPDPVKKDVPHAYSPAPVVKGHEDPDLAQVERDTRGKSATELLGLRSQCSARATGIRNDIAQREHDYSWRHPVSNDRNQLDVQTVGQIDKEIRFIDALLEAPAPAAA